jgi:flagellar biosynthetic protein FlhB
MADDSFQEKTEPATDKKRADAREKGKVLKSMDVNAALSLMTGLLVLGAGGSLMAGQLRSFATGIFSSAASIEVTPSAVSELVLRALLTVGVVLAPVLFALFVIGLLSNLTQVGFLFTTAALQPKLSSMNPGKGIKKIMMSRRSAVELFKNLFKVAIVAITAYVSLKGTLPAALTLMDGSVESVADLMVSLSIGVGWKVAVAFLAVSVGDYVFQKFEYERELRMSKQEVKEEAKMLEGDPAVRGKIRTIQRQIAYKRMMQDVPRADVVITNPTHLAIALKYDMAKMAAPTVVAKGADLIAQRIREIALEHGVPIVEDKPLARLLYSSADVGDPVPQKLFQAVAQVLAYIYRMRNMNQQYGVN